MPLDGWRALCCAMGVRDMNVVYAGDLSSDLGFGRNMPPRFWNWCKRHGLRAIEGKPLAFDRDDVHEALRRAGVK